MNLKTKIMIAEGLGLAAIAYLLTEKEEAPLRTELERFVGIMHKDVAKPIRDFIREVEATTGYRVEVASSHRGWNWSQQIWNSNPSVQACCPVGRDYHFFGFAIDIVLHGPLGRLGLAAPRSSWEATGIRAIARKYKLQWGIDFAGYYDPVHFALPLYGINDLVNRAVQKYGSLQACGENGPNIDTTGLSLRTWQIA